MDRRLVAAARFAAAAMLLAHIGAGRSAAEPQSAGRALVKGDDVAVHAGMSPDTEIVARLARGAAVTVELVLPGPSGKWCRISQVGAPPRSAYVPCETLELRPQQRWQAVGGAPAPARGPIRVPIRVINNITLVSATLNRTETAVMVVDTGASFTLITPALAGRLGLSLPENGPRRQARVVGGAIVEARIVRLAALQIGDARVDNLEVGVHELDPSAPLLGGLLGGDFLHQFKVTLDKAALEMRLE